MEEESERFKDNGDETLTDSKYNLMWFKQDTYQLKAKWCTHKQAKKFVQRMNEEKFAGYEDWRVPSSQECRNLYDHDCKNMDFNDDIVHIDYMFPEGCGTNVWCVEEQGNNAMIYNFYSDRGYYVRKTSSEDSFMVCRPVRTSGPKVKKSGRLSATGRSRRE